MSNTINKDNLIGSALAIDAMEYILQDIQEDYFDKFNVKNEKDNFSIIYEFNRNRAKIAVISLLLNQIKNEFKENKITCYSDQ